MFQQISELIGPAVGFGYHCPMLGAFNTILERLFAALSVAHRFGRRHATALLLVTGLFLLVSALISFASLLRSCDLGAPSQLQSSQSLEQSEQAVKVDKQPTVNVKAVSVLPDFTQLTDTQVRKQKFFNYLDDYVSRQNARIHGLREQIEDYADIANFGFALSPAEQQRLLTLARRYKVKTASVTSEPVRLSKSSQQALIAELLLRIDAIPISLVLAQAANESAWGTSRFAVEGNNLFGQWCYQEGCGFVPFERVDEASHEVERFDTVDAAVTAYFNNINTHPSYSHFRRMRARMREQERSLDPIQLAYGLGSYSQRGDNYIDELQTIIQQNDLQRRDEG
jgi:Bax protein